MLSVSDNPGKSPVFYKIQRDDGTVNQPWSSEKHPWRIHLQYRSKYPIFCEEGIYHLAVGKLIDHFREGFRFFIKIARISAGEAEVIQMSSS